MYGNLVDRLMVLFSLIHNATVILVFILRGQGREKLEGKLGPVFNALLIPFSLLWLLNLMSGRNTGRLITGIPVIVFLVYDLLYRTVTGKKPYHHPERWPLGLYVYVLLYQVSGIMLNGYSFLISLLYGYIVLASYFASLVAYGYYQYKYKKKNTKNLTRANRLNTRTHVDDLLFDFHDRRDYLLKGYSRGMKQKVLITAALIHDPPILFFDEPTSILDPHAALMVKDLIKGLADSAGKTIFICSHILPIVEELCERLGIINQGRLIALGTIDEIIAQTETKTLEEAFIAITRGVEEKELFAWREQRTVSA